MKGTERQRGRCTDIKTQERHKFIEREIEKVRQIDADTQTETANHVKDKRDKETQNKTT